MKNEQQQNHFLYPNWPAPKHVRAAVTLAPSGLDLSIHNPAQAEHTARLCGLLQLPSSPLWLQQTHGNNVVLADEIAFSIATRTEADACTAKSGAHVCAILTADCVPILLTDIAGTQVAAIHAGWRGQVAGIIEATITTMAAAPDQLLAWLGPAIGPAVYEVGADVYNQVMQSAANLPAELFFQPLNAEKWLFNLYALASYKLQSMQIPKAQIFGGDLCTYSDPSLFYSYRRTKTPKRHASLIWFAER